MSCSGFRVPTRNRNHPQVRQFEESLVTMLFIRMWAGYKETIRNKGPLATNNSGVREGMP